MNEQECVYIFLRLSGGAHQGDILPGVPNISTLSEVLFIYLGVLLVQGESMVINQKGFSAFEGLLILVIIGIVGGIGWYVFSLKDSDTAVTQTQTNTQIQPSTCNPANEEQQSWVVASSHENSFSICVPGGWTLVSDTQSESFRVTPPFAVVSGKKAVIQTQEIGGKDGASDMLLVFKAEESYQGWTSENAEKSDFTLNDGTIGIRYYTKHTNVGEGIGPVEGEEDYEYLFEKNGKFIHAVYTIHPGTEKQLETIESVLKTLRIN